MNNTYFIHCNQLANRIRGYQAVQKLATKPHLAFRAENAWRGLVSQLKFDCIQYQVDYTLFGIDENLTTPQLKQADVPTTAGVETNFRSVQADVPTTAGGEKILRSVQADVPTTAGGENFLRSVQADVPTTEIVKELMSTVQAIMPTSASRTKCRLSSCHLEAADGMLYCTDKHRVKFHNSNRKTKKKA